MHHSVEQLKGNYGIHSLPKEGLLGMCEIYINLGRKTGI